MPPTEFWCHAQTKMLGCQGLSSFKFLAMWPWTRPRSDLRASNVTAAAVLLGFTLLEERKKEAKSTGTKEGTKPFLGIG